jgi:hypothetical protein
MGRSWESVNGIPPQGHRHDAAHGAPLIIQLVHDDLNIKGIGNVLFVQDGSGRAVEKFTLAVEHQCFVCHAHGVGGIMGVHNGADAFLMR